MGEATPISYVFIKRVDKSVFGLQFSGKVEVMREELLACVLRAASFPPRQTGQRDEGR